MEFKLFALFDLCQRGTGIGLGAIERGLTCHERAVGRGQKAKSSSKDWGSYNVKPAI